MNQNDFSDPDNPVGDSFGDRTEFDLVDLGATTRIFLGDASDDWALDGDDSTPLPQAWRNDDVAGDHGHRRTATHDNAGWTELSSATNGRPGFGVYGYARTASAATTASSRPARASERRCGTGAR